MQEKKLLTQFSEEQRKYALEKYFIVQPYLDGRESLKRIAQEQHLSNRTLRLWINKYRNDGLVGLITKVRRDKGSMSISDETKTVIKKIYLETKNISIMTVYRNTLKWCEANSATPPSYYQVRKIIGSIANNLTTLAHDGKKTYSEKFDSIYVREAKRQNEIWQADHTLLDIIVIDSKGALQRPWLTVIMDDYSRAISGYFIDFPPPTAERTALTLRQAIWRKCNPDWPICGIPGVFYTDHGSDFTSKRMEQVAVDLKMNLSFSKVGIPRGRGKIERFFRTVNLMLLESLPGYTKGRTVGKNLTLEKFVATFDDWLLNTYHNKIHSTIHKSPKEMWNQPSFLPVMPDSLEVLDLLLLEVKKGRIVHNDGIHLFGMKYYQTNLSAFVGESVEIRYDSRDISDIRVFYQNEFLCTAVSASFEQYSVSLKEIEKERTRLKRNLADELKVSTQEVFESIQQQKSNSSLKNQKSKIQE